MLYFMTDRRTVAVERNHLTVTTGLDLGQQRIVAKA